MKAWVNGKFLPQEEATVPLLSHSFSRGSAIFEVLDVTQTPRGAALFRADAHIDRFFNSAEALGMPLPVSREELLDILKDTVRANALSSGGVKFFAYYAMPQIMLIPKDQPMHLAIFCFELASVFGEGRDVVGRTVTAGISSARKLSPESVPVHAKACGFYVGGHLAISEAHRRGYDDAIMLDEGGFVAEGAVTNVFFVKDGIIRTPKLRNVLPGITRDSVIEIAKALKLSLEETDILPEQAVAADEAFYTGSLIRISPIRSIDGNTVGQACPGPITSKILSALNNAYAGADSRCEAWLTYVD
jgi:branched-chain amino acid aminotransferase